VGFVQQNGIRLIHKILIYLVKMMEVFIIANSVIIGQVQQQQYHIQHIQGDIIGVALD
jgi:hypothetical protein